MSVCSIGVCLQRIKYGRNDLLDNSLFITDENELQKKHAWTKKQVQKVPPAAQYDLRQQSKLTSKERFFMAKIDRRPRLPHCREKVFLGGLVVVVRKRKLCKFIIVRLASYCPLTCRLWRFLLRGKNPS